MSIFQIKPLCKDGKRNLIMSLRGYKKYYRNNTRNEEYMLYSSWKERTIKHIEYKTMLAPKNIRLRWKSAILSSHYSKIQSLRVFTKLNESKLHIAFSYYLYELKHG